MGTWYRRGVTVTGQSRTGLDVPVRRVEPVVEVAPDGPVGERGVHAADVVVVVARGDGGHEGVDTEVLEEEDDVVAAAGVD